MGNGESNIAVWQHMISTTDLALFHKHMIENGVAFSDYYPLRLAIKKDETVKIELIYDFLRNKKNTKYPVPQSIIFETILKYDNVTAFKLFIDISTSYSYYVKTAIDNGAAKIVTFLLEGREEYVDTMCDHIYITNNYDIFAKLAKMSELLPIIESNRNLKTKLMLYISSDMHQKIENILSQDIGIIDQAIFTYCLKNSKYQVLKIFLQYGYQTCNNDLFVYKINDMPIEIFSMILANMTNKMIDLHVFKRMFYFSKFEQFYKLCENSNIIIEGDILLDFCESNNRVDKMDKLILVIKKMLTEKTLQNFFLFMIKMNNTKMIKLLLRNGVNPSYNFNQALQQAYKNQNVTIMKLLFLHGVDPNNMLGKMTKYRIDELVIQSKFFKMGVPNVLRICRLAVPKKLSDRKRSVLSCILHTIRGDLSTKQISSLLNTITNNPRRTMSDLALSLCS